MSAPKCRLCGSDLTQTFADLGMSPPCESYVEADELDQGETFYPLHVRICSTCLLVQLPAYLAGEDIFSHYAYFSSYSDSWVAHAKRYVQAAVVRLRLAEDSFVVEVASNDGYLLQHVRDLGIRCLGIEPAANIAEVARAKGIDTVSEFLGEAEPVDGGLHVLLRVRHPGVGVRREVGVVAEDVLACHVRRQLHQEAGGADPHVERVEHLAHVEP